MDEQNTFLLLPTSTGQGALVQRNQVVGARANGPTEGAILYTQAGPAIYTSMTTKDLARLFGAQVIEGAR
ncbi:MAG: hypothetical protein ACOY45_00890 [Pseudomonadota bacterium]